MSNFKAQSSKEIQISNIKYFYKKVLALTYFDIPLSFELWHLRLFLSSMRRFGIYYSEISYERG